MELDLDFAIEILEAMERADRSVIEPEEELLDGIDFEDERYSYHCLMLAQAGLIEIWFPSNQERTMSSPYAYIAEGVAVAEDSRIDNRHRVIAFPMVLTYEGHKFLEAMRNEGTRERLRELLTEKGLPWALTTVQEIGMKYLFG